MRSDKDCCFCIHGNQSPMSDVCRTCGIAMLNYEAIKITNGEMIRAMTDEELANRFDAIQDDAMCYGMHDTEPYFPIGIRNWLVWLAQEAEE